MSKQVELLNDTLFVSTREPYHKARRVIVQRKGGEAKVYYPFNYSRLTDPADIEDWNIGGYKCKDLLTLADILKTHNITEIGLREIIGIYLDGYNRGKEEITNAYNETIDKFINSIKEVNNAQLMDKIN